MNEVLGSSRQVVIARELTKLFESIHRTTLGEAVTWISADANRQRGEFVLVVEGRGEPVNPFEKALPLLKRLLVHFPLSEAVTLCAELTTASHKALYAEALALRHQQDDPIQ
jgi:16S rRNA (cytidine1402-2'-O)-methyltransferase